MESFCGEDGQWQYVKYNCKTSPSCVTCYKGTLEGLDSKKVCICLKPMKKVHNPLFSTAPVYDKHAAITGVQHILLKYVL